MNFQGPDGLVIDPYKVEEYAAKANISVRTGCFCNPGSIETINGLTKADVQNYFNTGLAITYDDYVAALPGKTLGALRVSLGIVSNFEDVYQFVQFARSFVDKDITKSERSCCAYIKHGCYSS